MGFQPIQSSYDAANRLVSAVSAVETNLYSYDGAGRLVAQTVNGEPRTYSYDFRSQMTALTDTNAASFSYDFDGDGNRISMIPVGTAGPAVRFVYDGPNVVLDLDATTLEPISAYVHGVGIDQPVEKIYLGLAIPELDRRAVYHTEALGSVIAMTDSTGALIKEYRYEAFGKLRYESGAGPLGGNRYTYTARESIGDSLGLCYYRVRVMDPNVGRFTSEDPLGFIDGANYYLYVRNQPPNRRDPSGLCSWQDCDEERGCNYCTGNPGTCRWSIIQYGALAGNWQCNCELNPL